MASVNLARVSPSSVGNFAACPQRLVWDTDFPSHDGSSPYADFGTLCHYMAMWKMGLNPPEPEHFELLEASARSIYRSDRAFQADLEAATNRAIKELPKLPPGVTWVCEIKAHKASLLPERINRKGEKKGFGGSVDLMSSDRQQLWDFKFQSKPPTRVKAVYLWQMASYHIVTDVPLCGLNFTTRDGNNNRTCKLDFRDRQAAEFAKRVYAFINYTGHADFRQNAYPVAGDHCDDFCDHKSRCFAYNLPSIDDSNLIEVTTMCAGGLDALMELTQSARLSPTGSIL